MSVRREDCAVCGAVIVGSTDDWELNARAVRRHNQSKRHAMDPTAAALLARARRAERRVQTLEVEAVRLRRQLRVVA